MPFDKNTRGRLQRFVNDARTLLSDEFSRQLQQDFGLNPETGDVADIEKLSHLDDQSLETAKLLREIMNHYLAADMLKGQDGRQTVLDRIVREQAFTVLNRLVALRMMEARGLLHESVHNGLQSEGFKLYEHLVGHGLGDTGDAYRVYLFSVFDEFAQELPQLFGRYSPQGRLFPRERALTDLLDLINAPDLDQLWADDEAIGWIYQYFNSKEERKAMRDASQAPRNSRELAVRNQFFTPRYVVEFLVDNTLGRLWCDAAIGQSTLREHCDYLLTNVNEISGADSRPRDPRTLKLLDPACGSMHFGLYAFDLFAEIYREAWVWEQRYGPGSLDLGTQSHRNLKPLKQSYVDEAEFLLDVPRLIIECNIYGVDIDPRAVQIASLALWLRAQRAWHDAGVRAADRPFIGHGHVVAAIAPPAEPELRQQITAALDRQDAVLFEKTLEMLKRLPELGVLLQVESELPHLVSQASGRKGTGLFAEEEQESWRQAEARLQQALTDFVHAARSTYQGILFAHDTIELLRLIDICQEDFDVVLMNPPFGSAPETVKKYLKENYPDSAGNLYVAFHDRAAALASDGGYVGVISSRTFITYLDFQAFRKRLIAANKIETLVDLGWGVLDGAQVETAAYVTTKRVVKSGTVGPFIKLLDVPVADKSEALLLACSRPDSNLRFLKEVEDFEKLPGAPLCYWASKQFVSAVSDATPLYPEYAHVGLGASPHAFFFRTWWEVPATHLGERWKRITRGGDYSPYYRSNALVIDWLKDGACVKEYILHVYPYLKGNYGWKIQDEDKYGFQGITWGKRNERFNAQAMPSGHIFTDEGQGIIPTGSKSIHFLLGYLNSSFVSYFLTLTSGLQKHYVYIRPVPILSLSTAIVEEIEDAVSQILEVKQRWDATSEISPVFHPRSIFISLEASSLAELANTLVEQRMSDSGILQKLQSNIDRLVSDNLDLSKTDLQEIEELRASCPVEVPNVYGLLSSQSVQPESELAEAICSYAIGVCFGRWDVSCLQTDNDHPMELPDPLRELPSCSPGMCRSDGAEDSRLSTLGRAGIIVEDKSTSIGLVAAVRDVFVDIWGESAEKFEQEILSALNVSSLGSYFSRPSGFFSYHLSGYTRTRRKAPIYLPLGTLSGRYTLWIYYPKLTDQTLYMVVNDFLEPKLKEIADNTQALRSKTDRNTTEEREFEQLQDLEMGLRELRETILDIAKDYVPNHDDGVQITAAPLWPLFQHKPWQKALKDTWKKLEKGDYDWAHLAMNYWPDRVKKRCKTDKSIAIAHGLEDLYTELPGK